VELLGIRVIGLASPAELWYAWPGMRLLCFLLVLVVAGSGCGGDDNVETQPPPPPDAGDGRVHPPPDGVHISETTACKNLVDAQGAKRLQLGCIGTDRTCPQFLRFEFGTECLEYDDGSVKGCIGHYNIQATCEDLNTAVKDCVVTPYPGTEPNGCP
jgi:hypothetical protein